MTDHPSEPGTPGAKAERVLTGRQIGLASGLIAIFFVLSGVLGVVRQAIIGGRFGAGSELDAFAAAYRIPEMLFTLIAGGALGSAFIPVFSRFLGKDDLPGAWKLASATITLVALAGTALAAAAFLFSEAITRGILLPLGTPAQQDLTAELMRIMLITVVIFGVSGLVMGILNAHQRFLAPALAPSMNNIGLIIGALLLAPSLGVRGLALGAVLGAALHLAIQIPWLLRIKPALRPVTSLRTPGVRDVLLLMGPRVLGSAAVQVNFVVNTALASGMAPGSLAALTFAFSLMFTVLGILGQSVGTAVFPTLAHLGAQENKEGFRQTLAGALRSVLFSSLPASVGMIALAGPLVATIYERGRWSAENTVSTAWALQFFALGLAAFALQEVLARAFYALRDTWTPVIIAVGGMLLNVALSLLLVRALPWEQLVFAATSTRPEIGPGGLWSVPAGRGPFGGLALANALATMVESVVLWLLVRRRIGGLDERNVLSAALRTLLAALAMGAVVVVVAAALAGQSPLVVLMAGTGLGLIAFEGASLSLGLPEARSVPAALLRRVRR